QYRQTRSQTQATGDQTANIKARDKGQQNARLFRDRLWTAKNVLASASAFIFSGTLLGVLPLWNTSVFIGATAVLLLVLILFRYRLQVMLLGITAAVVVLPQLLFLRSGEIGPR